MTRRVLILSAAYPPSSAVGAFRAARFAKFLPDYGWQPIVVTADSLDPHAPRNDSRSPVVNDSAIVVRSRPWRLPKFADRFRRSKSTNPAAPSAATSADSTNEGTLRAIDTNWRLQIRDFAHLAMAPFRFPDRWIWWSIPALRAMQRVVREYEPSVLVSTSPPHSLHLMTAALSAWSGIPVVMDLRDPWANTVWGEARDGRLRTAANRGLEKICVARADRVILNTPELLAEFQRHYPTRWREKFSAIPNGFDPQVRQQIETLVQSVAKPTGEPLKLCHAGTVYGRRDIRPLIEAVTLLNRQGRPVVFEQIGTLANRNDVVECVEKNRARDFVSLTGQQSHDEALRRMAAADVLVVVRQNTALQVPAKVYEMMLFGKPILALDGDGAMARIIRDYQLGIVADPVDPAAIAKGIEAAAAQLTAPPSEGRAAALRDFDAREQTAELANVLATAVESRRHSHAST